MKPTIVFLIGFLPNPRFFKRIALEKQIADIHLICWDRGDDKLSAPTEEICAAHVIKIDADNDPVKRLLPYRKFAARAKDLLNRIKPDLIHVQGLDMLRIAAAYKKRSRKTVSVVYEVADLHHLLVDPQTTLPRKAAQRYLKYEEKRLEPMYDLLIITSEKFFDLYFKHFVSAEKVLCMPNVPDLSHFVSYQKKDPSTPFTVGYIGAIRYKKQIQLLLDVAEKNNLRLMFAGYENEPAAIEAQCKGNPNIEWIGKFDFSAEAAKLYGKCDVVYSVYDADMHNVRIALPNKLYEAIYCEIPLIVAKNTYLAKLTESWGVGVAVNDKDPADLEQALCKLRDDTAYYESFAANCRKKKDIVDLEKHNAVLKARIEKLLKGNSAEGQNG